MAGKKAPRKVPQRQMPVIQACVEAEIAERLDAEAAELGMFRSAYLRLILRKRYAGGRDPSPGEL